KPSRSRDCTRAAPGMHRAGDCPGRPHQRRLRPDHQDHAARMNSPLLRERTSPNHDGRGERARIDMLVLHYTGMQSAEAAIERLCDPGARVSAHYVIEENGTTWRLVPEKRRAFHAGIACWEGETGLNA